MAVKHWIGLGVGVVVVLSAGALGYHDHQTAATTSQLQEAQAGAVLFQQMCETCHGPGGNGAGNAPVLNDGSVTTTYPTTTALANFIQTHMPASDPGILTSQQATELALYIRQLNHLVPQQP
ncbi:MAG: c-type cytochrome [Sulfobacillus sp.]|nr:c-type cytochrome [Sulfobacillus sp.]